MSEGLPTVIAAGLAALGVIWVAYAKQRHELRVRHLTQALEQLAKAFDDFTSLYDALAAVAASRTFANIEPEFERKLDEYRAAHCKAMSSAFFIPPELDLEVDRVRLEIPAALARIMSVKRLANAECIQLLIVPFASLLAFRDAGIRWRRASWRTTFGKRLEMESVDFQLEPDPLDQRWLDDAKKKLTNSMVATPGD